MDSNNMIRISSALARAAGLIFAGSAQAATATFDFESLSTTSGGALTTLTLSNSGLTIVLTRPGSSFDITDLTSTHGPSSFGARTLDPFHDHTNTPFVVTFSQPVTGVSFQSGDYDGDPDTSTLNLFSGVNGTGANLGSTSVDRTAAATFPGDVDTLSLSAAGILSATFIGGSMTFPNSVYYDNFVIIFGPVSTVPEPATLVILGTGLAALSAVRRRRT